MAKSVIFGILNNGRQVAVKTLSAESKQGVGEFFTEINTISNIRHPNLVELIGCSVQGSKRALVYEYLENNSLDHALLGRKSKTVELDWGKRSAICMGTARGPYSNPYLRFVQYSGYLAPEYVLGGQLTMKADVYSFGVLISEWQKQWKGKLGRDAEASPGN
ncbi:cold-responsive protein kinase 1-like [Actinidia eriantha]|uniref:cold-responsive protein kinase 1-like n=1 Tax=Actinidia eriantha TaxID=165200 RepID=UPI002588A995|nr:cold-responsive protein kinase 1-like [Actinidia eriantha]